MRLFEKYGEKKVNEKKVEDDEESKIEDEQPKKDEDEEEEEEEKEKEEKEDKEEKEEEEKVAVEEMPKNRYSFEYRKRMAQYWRRFAFYSKSLEELTSVLKDEIEFYHLESA